MRRTQKETTGLQGKLSSQRVKPTVIKILSPLEAERKARQLERKKFNAVINGLTKIIREKEDMKQVLKTSVNDLWMQVLTLRAERDKSQQIADSYKLLQQQFNDLLKYSSALARMRMRDMLSGDPEGDMAIIKKMEVLNVAFSIN